MVPCGDLGGPSWIQGPRVSSFDSFCEYRARLMLDRAREVVGNSLKDGAAAEDELVEED